RAAARVSRLRRRRGPSDRRRPVQDQAKPTMSRRVLVVDDEKGIREALQQLLEYEQIEVRTGATGAEALTLYAEFRPHLVFLDVKMQGLDAIATLKRRRELDHQAQAVLVSGDGPTQRRAAATPA